MNARVARGHAMLLTGIGGGVALGAHVYVTSGSDAKLARAIALGAAGGANYTHGQFLRLLLSFAGMFLVFLFFF